MFRFLLPVLFLGAQLPVSATVLTFAGDVCSLFADGSGAFASCPNGASINQAYGDSALVNFTYGASNINGSASMQLWGDPNVYSDLPKAAYGFAFSSDVFIQMQALGGGTVTLGSFALGTTPPTFTRTAAVRVVDLATNTVVFSTGSVTVGGATATPFTPNVSSLVGLRLEVSGDMFNTGIGNFNFTADPGGAGGVPEPSTIAMIGVGLALVVCRRSFARVRTNRG
ncbi:MAG: PEP-CTERM sorting domain-containing protein [Bryobacterales bacterium]|nr:PEP-CTERM sorting domain-containing protein [Bryobacterales bacterium]